MSQDYGEFLAGKLLSIPATGLTVVPPLHEALFPFQRDITAWALRRGRAAIFADCGLGKTIMQLEWARHVPGRVLILAPLAVAGQIEREGIKFGLPVRYRREPTDDHVTVTNYELLHRFDPSVYTGVVLDESSILKAFDGATRNLIVDSFRQTPYRLACTATPAPNDYTELGNHVEFLGIMTRAEMLATFFVHDSSKTQDWQLKGHATTEFWRWLASWAVMLRKPSDLGYEDDGFILPALEIVSQVVESTETIEGFLLPIEAVTLDERRAARKASIGGRVELCRALVAAEPSEPWLIWCNLNAESAALAAAIPGAVEVRGSDSVDEKEAALSGFADGRIKVLVTKPSIAGHGMNWQHCARMAFVGLSDSWEQYYQAIRRCWRFGQTRPVVAHLITATAEGQVLTNIRRKEADAARMFAELVKFTQAITEAVIHGSGRQEMPYEREHVRGDGWDLHLGDCVDVLGDMESESVHYSIFSPPFASLYTYSNSLRDMGNVRDGDEFVQHFCYAVEHIYRVLMSGRLVSFHCMNLPTSKFRDGYIGLRDFRGELIHLFQEAGFIYHSEVCIWKDPVTAMQRTKALGLLYKQLRKDSSLSRQGIADYLVTMRKPGQNPELVSHTPDSFPLSVWQRYASPIWDDIDQSDVLTFREAREHNDERHICPLQLTVIRRAVRLWTNEGDLVLSPFAGIGSEGYVALEEGRQFVGVELKRSYWEQAQKNLKAAQRMDLFSSMGA